MALFLIPITFFAALICAAATPVTIFFAKKAGLVDNPKKRPHPAHTHAGIIPRAGGVPLFLGIFVPLVVLVPFSLKLAGIFLGALLLVATGIWDDKKDRSPYIRLFINVAVALLVVLSGIHID